MHFEGRGDLGASVKVPIASPKRSGCMGLERCFAPHVIILFVYKWAERFYIR